MEVYRDCKSLLTFSGGLGDAVLSTAAVRRAQFDDPDGEFHVGVWNKGQEEVFRSLEVPVVRIPVESRLGFRRRVKSLSNWPGVLADVAKLSYLVHSYDRVIGPVVIGPIYYLAPFFRKFIPGDKERFLPMPHPLKALVEDQYIGFTLQDRIDALLGAGGSPYFPPELGFSRQHSEIADRMWAETGVDPRKAVVCNFRTSNWTKDFTPSQVEFIINFVQRHHLSPVIINYSPEYQEILMEKFAGNQLVFVANSSVLAMGEFLRKARAHVSADTGLAHVAGIVGTPTLVAFGPGNKENWVYPGHSNVSSIQANMACKTLSCRSGQVCSQPDTYCISRISLDEFAEKLKTVISFNS